MAKHENTTAVATFQEWCSGAGPASLTFASLALSDCPLIALCLILQIVHWKIRMSGARRCKKKTKTSSAHVIHIPDGDPSVIVFNEINRCRHPHSTQSFKMQKNRLAGLEQTRSWSSSSSSSHRIQSTSWRHLVSL